MPLIKVSERTDKKEPTRHYSKKQENSVAKAVGGQRTKNSGATRWEKGDILTDDSSFLIECKTKMSHSDSISIKKEWFDKNTKEAVFQGKKYTALVFNFGPDEENHYIIDEDLFVFLLDKLKE